MIRPLFTRRFWSPYALEESSGYSSNKRTDNVSHELSDRNHSRNRKDPYYTSALRTKNESEEHIINVSMRKDAITVKKEVEVSSENSYNVER